MASASVSPSRSKCPKCTKSVTDHQPGLLCVECKHWYHVTTKCLGLTMDKDLYTKLGKIDSIHLICKCCMKKKNQALAKVDGASQTEPECLEVNVVTPAKAAPVKSPVVVHARNRPSEKLRLREHARDMFTFGYDNYMKYAFPLDELDPLHCTGRGPDYDNPSNININDVLGDYCLTLVDSLDTLAIMGNASEFRRAVNLVIEYVSFNDDHTVQVFEATIRVLGGLLSAHLLIVDPAQRLGDFTVPDYDNELLLLAHDLASRLLPAFENTSTGLPHPRVNLLYGLPTVDGTMFNETCLAGAGSLLFEFGILSRLLDDPTYESLARRTNKAIWKLRNPETGLFGYTLDVQTGEWTSYLSGVGAGMDSFYEYLLKSYILFGDSSDFGMFNDSYGKIKEYLRRGRPHCNTGTGDPPIYVNVHMQDGTTLNTWIDALQAAFVGVQILSGDLDEAICAHLIYHSIWRKYGVIPERFNWQLKAPDVSFYPLRPEFAETTYLLYRATKNPFYLHVGQEILENLEKYTRAQCGYATVHNVDDMSLEDRMESFFLSETCKYLFLLFDEDNPVNKNYASLMFSTEGHVFFIDAKFRRDPIADLVRQNGTTMLPDENADRYSSGSVPKRSSSKKHSSNLPATVPKPQCEGRPEVRAEWKGGKNPGRERSRDPVSDSSEDERMSPDTNDYIASPRNYSKETCHYDAMQHRYQLPVMSHYLRQLENMIGVPGLFDDL